ncbi:MAG: hypothetical protein ACRDSK_13695 [Actinophytocola sp.]|uniref:hypothetical protein n=1 Tax=Actinophytocola sp. TaxID=1872138 RepID=UPI003D6A796E
MDTKRLDRIGNRRVWVVGLLAVLLAGAGGWALAHLEWERAAEEEAKQEAVQTAEQLCDQIERMGRRCEVQPPAAEGEPGLGIADTTTEGCYVRLTYTDDTAKRVGPFCGDDGSPGPSGPPGPTGPPGVSITGVISDGCMITVTLSNGQTFNAGPFCGRDGADGEDGTDGLPGRSLIGQDCIGDGDDSYWRLTWREPDGATTETRVDGPCRLRSRPNSSPSPTPPPIVGGD